MNERKPRVCFCSSVSGRSTRQRLETSAAGPPNSRRPMPKTMSGKTNGDENTLSNPGPTTDMVFQLPIPPTIKPTMEDAFTSGVSSSQCDLASNKES